MFKEYKDDIEPFNRCCPICGDEIKKGTLFHKCDDNKLKKLKIEDLNKEEEELKIEERTFDDRLKENEYFLDNNDDEEDY